MAVGLLALAITIPTLRHADRLPQVYRPVVVAFGLAAVAAIGVGALRLTPWVSALLLVAILSAV